jgi:hypothetical protein
LADLRITNISKQVLDECRWDDYGVVQKMSCASDHNTTHLEDEAYCPMGLFDVNMPLLYSETARPLTVTAGDLEAI